MAHLKHYGDLCPTAKPIIHLGATSCYVGDNTDIVVLKQALSSVRSDLEGLIRLLCSFALEWAEQTNIGVYSLSTSPTDNGRKRVLSVDTRLLLMDFLI